MSEEGLLQAIRQRVEALGSQREAARSFGVSDAFLCDVLKRRRDIGPKIAASFGYRPLKVYVRQGEGGLPS